MAQAHKLPNYRQIKVTFVPPTNTKGGRIKVWEPKRYNDDKTDIVYISPSINDDVQNTAFKYLISKGFNVVARASEQDYYIFLVDNRGTDMLNLKGEKQ